MEILPFHLAAGRAETQLRTSLDGVVYQFRIFWNERDDDTGADGAWYFDVAESDGTPIADGVKIVLGTFLARTTEHALTRKGALLAYDTTRNGGEATFTDLGTRVVVVHVTDDEILAAVIREQRRAAAAAESSA